MTKLTDPPKSVGVFLPPLLLTLLCFGLYWGSLSAPWHLDDWSFIAGDPSIQQFWPIGGHVNRPVLTFSLVLNNAFCGLDPAGFRFVNVLIHACTASLLFALLQRLLRSGRLGAKAADGAQALAFSISALWMAHPINTMAVTYVWQRSESLMGLFFIATLYSVQRCSEGFRPKSWGVLAVALCLLGIGTKEVMVAVIPVALILDAVLLAPSLREALRRRWALHGSLVLILTALLVIVAPRTSTSQGELGRWVYAASQPGVVVDYIRLSILPWPLCFDYDRAPAQGLLAIILPSIPIVGALGATLWGLMRRSWMGVAGALFFLVLAPTSSFVEINDLMVEYRLYLPLLAPVTLLSALAWVLWDRWKPRLPLTALFLAVLCVLSLATIRRNQDYSTNERLWKSVLEVSPTNVCAMNCLAAGYLESNEPSKAIPHALRATGVQPGFYAAHMNLGTALKLTGDLAGAVEEFKLACKIRPRAKERCHIGQIFLELDQPRKAESQFRLALARKPNMIEARLGIARARMAIGSYKLAKRALLRIVEHNPDHAEAWFLLGTTERELGLLEQSAIALERAVEIDDRKPLAWTNLARISVMLRRWERAAQAFGQAVKLDPKNHSLQFNYGRTLAGTGQPEEATRVLKALLQSKPSMAREVSSLASKLARGDSINKQTAVALAQLAVQSTSRADHITLLHLVRVLVSTGDAWTGAEVMDEILALPAVRGNSKLLSTYVREQDALEKYLQDR
ncbi:MAG: tetratricopeptide repeat protein [bacterium]|nr:tetratricopeptide repeat protein [bacterium]